MFSVNQYLPLLIFIVNNFWKSLQGLLHNEHAMNVVIYDHDSQTVWKLKLNLITNSFYIIWKLHKISVAIYGINIKDIYFSNT